MSKRDVLINFEGTIRKENSLIMRTTAEDTQNGAPLSGETVPQIVTPDALLATVTGYLEDAKAEDINSIDIKGKSPMGDYMIVASGRSQRHVGAIADQIVKKLKSAGLGRARVEGLPHCDWVLIDTGDVIVHIFRPEVREFYNLEKIWSADRPNDALRA